MPARVKAATSNEPEAEAKPPLYSKKVS